MARKHTIPGVDEAALSELARQFPTHDIGDPPRLSEDAPRGPAATGALAPRRNVTGGIALVLSLVALAAIAVPYVAPTFREELTELLGEGPLLQTVLGDRGALDRIWGTERAARAEMERRLAADQRAVTTQVEQLTALAQRADTRLSAIEAVGGGGFETASRRVEAVETALTAAASRLGAVEASVAEARSGADAAAARLGLVEAGMTETKGALDAIGHETAARLAHIEQQALSLIEEKMASLEQQVTAAAGAAGEAAEKAASVEQNFGELRQFNRTSVRLFLIALHLRTAIQTPAPFEREVTAVRAVAGNDAEVTAALKILADHSNGVRTVSELRDSFSMVAGQQVKALAAGLDPSWASRLTAMVAGPQPPRGGDGERVWRVVVQAEQALAQGNLAAAINQIERFDGPAGAAVADWLRDARARLAVENAAAQLSIYALNQLVSGS